MQTFLPYPNFGLSVECLDKRRLNKQCLEGFQILAILLRVKLSSTKDSYIQVGPEVKLGWQNHPAVKMWQGHAYSLATYVQICILEAKDRKINVANYESKLYQLMPLAHDTFISGPYFPKWFGDEAFHAAHRSNLLRKDPKHYSQFGWSEPDNLPYIWPKP